MFVYGLLQMFNVCETVKLRQRWFLLTRQSCLTGFTIHVSLSPVNKFQIFRIWCLFFRLTLWGACFDPTHTTATA